MSLLNQPYTADDITRIRRQVGRGSWVEFCPSERVLATVDALEENIAEFEQLVRVLIGHGNGHLVWFTDRQKAIMTDCLNKSRANPVKEFDEFEDPTSDVVAWRNSTVLNGDTSTTTPTPITYRDGGGYCPCDIDIQDCWGHGLHETCSNSAILSEEE